MDNTRTDSTGRVWTLRSSQHDMWFHDIVARDVVYGVGVELQALRIDGQEGVYVSRALVIFHTGGFSIPIHNSFVSFESWGQAADAMSEWWDAYGLACAIDFLDHTYVEVREVNEQLRKIGMDEVMAEREP